MTAFEPPADAITITFPQPAALLNMNDREHWRPRAKKKKAWRETARDYAAISQRCRVPLPASYFAITLDVATNRHRDPANYTDTSKCALDGCVDAGLWPSDDSRYVTTLEPRLRHSPDRLVTVHIWPRDGAA